MKKTGNNNKHVGNEQLRNLARSRVYLYSQSSKKDKSRISRELVNHIRSLDPSGHFLKKNTIKKCWEDVGDEVAREKASQALRDAVSEWNKGNRFPQASGYAEANLPPLSPPSLPKEYRQHQYKDGYNPSRQIPARRSYSMSDANHPNCPLHHPRSDVSSSSPDFSIPYRYDKRPPPVVTPDDPEHWREMYASNARSNAFDSNYYNSQNEHRSAGFMQQGEYYQSRNHPDQYIEEHGLQMNHGSNCIHPYQHISSSVASYPTTSARSDHFANEVSASTNLSNGSQHSEPMPSNIACLESRASGTEADDETLDNFDLFQW